MNIAYSTFDTHHAGCTRTHVLHPGDVMCAERGDRLETLLGSCVAVILTDPRRSFGAMCHIVYPGKPRPGAHGDTAYADTALNALYAQLQARALRPSLCEAYVYGGGNMFPHVFVQTHVGERNADWVLHALKRDGVRTLVIDIGGPQYRRLRWTVGEQMPQVTAVCV